MRNANETSFRGVYTEYFPFVWRCLRGLGVPDAALDDAAQEVFLVVHRRLAEFRGEASLRTWLYSILRNVAMNQRTKERRRPTVPLDAALEQAGPDPAPEFEDREAVRFVAEFVAKLDDKKRDIFVLAFVEGMSIPEVSEVLSVPVNTAYTRLRTVRLELERAHARRRDLP